MRYRGSKSIVAMFAVGVAGSAMAQSPKARPAPLSSPGSWFSEADYPAESMRSHQEGAVGFALEVRPDGAVASCAITASSGSAALDTQTCRLAQERARFAPASDAVRHFSSRVRWVLPAVAAPTAPAAIELPGNAVERLGSSDLWVDSDGFVTRCERIPMPYNNVLPPGDLCALYAVGFRFSPPTLLHGKPVKRRVRVTLTISDTYLK